MPEPWGEGDVSLACASALIDALAGNGVAGACISPGSRSTPLALAVDRHGGIPIHVHLDERSSAFFALGLAKATGRPAVVITTSGTATANLFPAVVEAAMSRTPMILLTADRPPELRGTGANQTIDQVGMFGSYVRWAIDAEPPSAAPGWAGTWSALGRRAVAESLGPPSGPVHLDLPFREPLVPLAGGDPAPRGRARAATDADGSGHRPAAIAATGSGDEPWSDAGALDDLAALISSTERGILLVGWLDPWTTYASVSAVERLADATGWPLVAEPLSGLRRPPFALGAGQHLLTDDVFARTHAPEVVLQFGGSPTTRASQALTARADRLVVVNPGPADPSRAAAMTFATDPGPFAAELRPRLGPAIPPGSAWASAWSSADAAVRTVVDGVLDAFDEPFEGRLARDLAAAIPEGSSLFAGSSMPVRDLDAYMAPRAGVRVLANRGASGIDGSVSTIFGIAAAVTTSPSAPTFGLIGDLALLYDAGALLWAGCGGIGRGAEATAGVDAIIVVPNNRGGGIFDHLAAASLPEHERLFVTPHHVDFARFCASAGVAHALVEGADDLGTAIGRAAAAGGIHILEVPVDRPFGIRARATVRAAVREELASRGYPDAGGGADRS